MNVFVFGIPGNEKSNFVNALQAELGSDWSSEINRVDGVKNSIISADIPWRKRRPGEIYFLLSPRRLKKEEVQKNSLHRMRENLRNHEVKNHFDLSFKKLNDKQVKRACNFVKGFLKYSIY